MRRVLTLYSPLLAFSGFPWVNNGYLQSLEMPDIPRGKGCAMRKRDSGNLCIAKVNWSSRSLPSRSECCRFGCRCTIKIQDAIFEVFLQHASERLLQVPPASTRRQQGNAEARFKYRDTGRPDRLCRLSVEPARDPFLGLASHERRKHIGIQDDQSCSSAGLGLCPRISGRSESRPCPRNRSAIRDPSRPVGRPSSLAATRRISRTSASMLRPWRFARRCRRAFTSSSNRRTIICAIPFLQTR